MIAGAGVASVRVWSELRAVVGAGLCGRGVDWWCGGGLSADLRGGGVVRRRSLGGPARPRADWWCGGGPGVDLCGGGLVRRGPLSGPAWLRGGLAVGRRSLGGSARRRSGAAEVLEPGSSPRDPLRRGAGFAGRPSWRLVGSDAARVGSAEFLAAGNCWWPGGADGGRRGRRFGGLLSRPVPGPRVTRWLTSCSGGRGAGQPRQPVSAVVFRSLSQVSRPMSDVGSAWGPEWLSSVRTRTPSRVGRKVQTWTPSMW